MTADEFIKELQEKYDEILSQVASAIAGDASRSRTG